MERLSDKTEICMNWYLKCIADRFSNDSWQYIAKRHSQHAEWYSL